MLNRGKRGGKGLSPAETGLFRLFWGFGGRHGDSTIRKQAVAVDHILRKEDDNKTIGLLVCKTKDNVLARYALESTSQPIGISEYELSKLYPERVEGTIPTTDEIEARLVGIPAK